MENSIFNFLDWFAFAGSLALLVYSSYYSWKRNLPVFLKLLPIYCFVTVANEIVIMVYPQSQPLIYLLFTFIELLFFSIVLSTLSRNGRFTTIICFSNAVFAIVVGQFIIRHRTLPFGFPEELESAILVIGSAICYLKMLNSDDNIDLWKKPGFWMIGGILLYFTFLMPSLVCSTALIRIGRPDLGKRVFSVSNVALLASYFLYFKAMTCLRSS